jgi:hypothetical protein
MNEGTRVEVKKPAACPGRGVEADALSTALTTVVVVGTTETVETVEVVETVEIVVLLGTAETVETQSVCFYGRTGYARA